MRAILILALSVAAVVAVPKHQEKIVGGALATINQYPFAAALLHSADLTSYKQECGGTILTATAVLSAAHCFVGDGPNRWRVRVGSSFANSGGSVHNLVSIIMHQSYNRFTLDNDLAMLRTETPFTYVANTVAAAMVSGSVYNLPDNSVVWGIGWGETGSEGLASEQLREVQVWVINQAECRSRYEELGEALTGNMVCSGWFDFGGRDQCQGDNGSPIVHNNVVVGVTSWSNQCGNERYPSVSTRTSQYTSWIQFASA